MATSDDAIDLRAGAQQQEEGGRSGRSGLGRLRRGRGGTDVVDQEPDEMAVPEAPAEVAAQPVSRHDADAWFSLADPVEYDEWGDPIVKGVPRGPNTVGLRRMSFGRQDASGD